MFLNPHMYWDRLINAFQSWDGSSNIIYREAKESRSEPIFLNLTLKHKLFLTSVPNYIFSDKSVEDLICVLSEAQSKAGRETQRHRERQRWRGVVCHMMSTLADLGILEWIFLKSNSWIEKHSSKMSPRIQLVVHRCGPLWGGSLRKNGLQLKGFIPRKMKAHPHSFLVSVKSLLPWPQYARQSLLTSVLQSTPKLRRPNCLLKAADSIFLV